MKIELTEQEAEIILELLSDNIYKIDCRLKSKRLCGIKLDNALVDLKNVQTKLANKIIKKQK
jgi:hypothetical protein